MSHARPLSEYLEDPRILEPPQPIIPDLGFMGKTTLLVGREKSGKSTLATAAAAAVSRGGSFLGVDLDQGTVLWFALDEPTNGLVRRLVQHRADEERVHLNDNRGPDAEVTLYEDTVRLNPSLIVVDTLDKYALPHRLEKSDSAGWSAVMDGLARTAREAEAAMLIIHHATKASGTYRDSTSIGAGVDVIATMSGSDGGNIRRFEMQARFPVDDFSIRLTGIETDLPHYERIGELSIDERVRDYIQSNPRCTQRAVRNAVRGSNSDIAAALDRLQKAGAVRNAGDGSSGAYESAADR